MEEVLIDTDIFIDIFRGDDILRAEIADYHQFTSIITYIELIQGENTSRNDIKKIKYYLSNVRILHLTEGISERAMYLVEEYGPSHNLKLADGLIAATALEYEMHLRTNNKRDFQYIDGIEL